MSDEADSWVFPVLDDEEKHGLAKSASDNENLPKFEDGMVEQSSWSNEERNDMNKSELLKETNQHQRILMETILALICTFIYINLIMNRFLGEIQSLRDDVQILKDSINNKGNEDDTLERQILQNDLIALQTVANLLHRNLCRQRFSAIYQDETLLDLVPYMMEHAINSTALWFGTFQKKVGHAMEIIYESSMNTFQNSIVFINSASSVMTSVSLMFKNTLSSLKSVVINSISSMSRGNATKIL